MKYRKCYYCNEIFDASASYLSKWVYKKYTFGLLKYFCSNKCMCDYEKSDMPDKEKEEYNKKKENKKK